MEMIFNHMPAEYYADKKISANAKLVLQRLFTLSKDGTQPVYAQRKFLAKELGISMNTVTNVFRELSQNNYITEIENTNSFDRTRRFSITLKSCDNEITNIVPNTNKSCEDNSTKVVRSPLDRNKARNKREDLTLSFDSVFTVMLELKQELKDLYQFDTNDLQDDAKSFVVKFKGKVTRENIRAWMIQGFNFRKQHKKEKSVTPAVANDSLKNNDAVARFEEIKRQFRENNLKKDDPVEADFEIIEEHKNKNAPA
jgi:DNA-binding MarR family transcriptional regulator